jgi:hypothetical protein
MYAQLYLIGTLLTTLVLIVLFAGGTVARHPKLFLSSTEAEALSWLRQQVPTEGVVLSSTELGAFVPAFTNQRVVSGHGFETVEAKTTEARVRQFYLTATPSAERRKMLAEWDVDHVLLGPRERRMGLQLLAVDDGVVLLTQVGDVQIYQVALP